MKLVTPILLIILSVGIFYTYINEEYEDILELSKEKKDFLDKQRDGNEIKKKRNDLEIQYKQIGKENTDRLEKLLPNHVNNVNLIVDIQRIIKENVSNIRIDDISVSNIDDSLNNEEKDGIEVDGNKEYKYVYISFSFSTKYANFKRFIENIRRSLRVLDVVSVKISNNTSSNEKVNDTFKFDIKLRTYWLKDE